MRILYIQPGRGIGGSKISLAALLDAEMAERSSQVGLTPPVEGLFQEMLGEKLEKIHPVYLPGWLKREQPDLLSKVMSVLGQLKRGWYLLPVLRLAQIIRKEKIDLVHTNNIVTPVGALAAWLTRTPHIWHVREPIGAGSSFPLALSDRRAVNFMHKTSQAILCNSAYTAGIFHRHGIPVRVVLNGVDMKEFADCQPRGIVLRNKLGAALEHPLVGMVGSLGSTMKEHGLFLEAMKQVKDRVAGCWFVVFGGMSDLNQTAYTRGLAARAAELGLSSRLTWAERIENIPAMMGSLDVLVHPTSGEGSGRVVMEAMAAGVPVVAVQSGGVQELIRHGETGLLVKPKDAQALAAAVLDLLDDPPRLMLMGENARRYAQEHFSHARTAAEIAQVYREALERRGRRRGAA